VSIASNNDTDSTKESDGKYDSEHHPDVDMHLEYDADALCGDDLDSDVDMERDGDDEEEEDDNEEDEEGKDKEEEDEDEEHDEDEDDGKEPQTIGQGEMVITSADDIDTMVDDQPIVLPEQDQEMRERTPWPQSLAPAPWPGTPDGCPQPQTAETLPLGGLEVWGFRHPTNLAHRCQPCENGTQP